MSETLKERSEMDPQYMWDLSTLYKDDAAWEEDLKALDPLIDNVASFQGKLNNAVTIYNCLEADTILDRKLSNLFVYANVRRSEDTRAEAAQSLYMRIYSKYVEAVSRTAFVSPEILSLPEKELKEIAKDPVLSPYAFTMEKLLKQKPHTLTADQEQLLASFGEVFAAPSEIATNLQDADLVFEDCVDGEGNTHEVTDSNYINLQMSEDRELRKNSFKKYYKGYRQHINTFAATYSGTVKGAVAEAKVRHYGSSREMFMAGENIPVSVYDSLIEAVRNHLPAMYRYVDLRKKMLGIDDLHYYDVYAPLVAGSDKKYPYEEAQKLVLAAVEPLGKEYGDIVRSAFRDRWIDVYPNKGKSGGAYSTGSYDSNPFIMANYTDNLDSVSTIAHEMGHSLHTWFSHHAQPPQYADYTIFVAEVASTVNENLLTQLLLKDTTDPKERLALLNHYLEGFKGTVYRQTMFAEFEKGAHAMAEQGQPLTPAALNALYGGLVKDYFGPALVMDEEVESEWARIPHFYSPFYVYKYATSYSAAVAISEAILKEGEPAVTPYLEFLHMGGSQYPLDELRHAGVDLSTPDPVNKALDKFEEVLDEAEQLADKL